MKKFTETGSMDRRHGLGLFRTLSSEENIDLIEELVSRQAEQSHTQLAPRKIAEQTGISQ